MEEHLCLRCGWCCEFPDVDLEDEGIKPMREKCRHLTQVVIENDLLKPASCDIHNTKPLDCTFSPSSGPCEIGIRKWKKKKLINPNAVLPEYLKKIL